MNKHKQNEFNERILALIEDIYNRADKNYIELEIYNLKYFLENNEDTK